MAEHRTATVAALVSAAELADWWSKGTPEGVRLSALIRQAMARTRTWTAPATEVERERTLQIARIGNNLNQIAHWANTYASAVEAVEGVAHLVAFERALAAQAPAGCPKSDVH